MAAAEVPFLLTLGDDDTYLNLNDSDDRKFYIECSKALPHMFDLNGEHLHGFLDAVENRASDFSLLHLFDVYPLGYNSAEETPADEMRNLLSHYGEITLEVVRHNAVNTIQTDTRSAQEEMMLYACLHKSLTQEAANKISYFKDEYYVLCNGRPKQSGTCYLKVIIRESYMDTNATARILRDQLLSLDTLMGTCQSDITQFNEKVHNIIRGLTARGKPVPDFTANLFRAYKAASNASFVDYIKRHEEHVDDNDDISAAELMKVANNKYRLLVESKEWSQPVDQDAEIVALEAALAKKKANANKRPTTYEGSKGSKKVRFQEPNSDKPHWKKVPPQKGEKHTKKVNKKTYHWCHNHKAWTIHSPAECKGVQAKYEPVKGNYKKDESNKGQPQVQLTQALLALQDSE